MTATWLLLAGIVNLGFAVVGATMVATGTAAPLLRVGLAVLVVASAVWGFRQVREGLER